MPDFTHVNWIGVVIAAVLNMVLGYIYYLPRVGGRLWETAAGRVLTTPSTNTYIAFVVTSLVMAYVLALLVGGSGLLAGGVWGILIWLGFVATVSAAGTVFEGRTWAYWGIVNAYWLISLLVQGALLGTLAATM